MVTGEAVDVGVYVVGQVPPESMQDGAENVPCPDEVHTTVPVGDEPVTVAVHDVGTPTATEEGEQLTALVVATPESGVTTMEPDATPGAAALNCQGEKTNSNAKTAIAEALGRNLPIPDVLLARIRLRPAE